MTTMLNASSTRVAFATVTGIGDYSPIGCDKLRLVSFVLLAFYVISILSNSTLLGVLFGNGCVRNTPINVLVIALTVLNLVGTQLQLPFVIISNFKCR